MILDRKNHLSAFDQDGIKAPNAAEQIKGGHK